MLATEDNVTLVGTAHVSRKSVEQVRETIRELEPDVVCVELDEGRLKALREPDAWAELPLLDLIRQGTGPQLLAQVLLGSYQQRIGEKMGVKPGEELLAAVEEAEAIGAEVVLADREVGITLRRALQAMGLREKARIGWEMTKAVFVPPEEEELDAEAVDALLQEDALTAAMEELADVAPSASHVLIDERDAYMASSIGEAAEATDGPVVAVLGAGHLQGVRQRLAAGERADRAELESLETTKLPWGKIFAWTLATAILGLFAYLGYQGWVSQDFSRLGLGALWYVVISGIPAALGCIIAGGHLLAVIVAFLASPLTSLNPALAAGWFAGAVEAWHREPTVGDVEGLKHIETFSDMRENRLVRVLLVAALVNLGSMLGSTLGAAKLLEVAFG
ncbi:MAG: TraB/GumN family protein [Candidatus Thermoplasmatota archaeon]|nr:TraB/GumN family protein [Candidatus Thermoplasmatota archaeon]